MLVVYDSFTGNVKRFVGKTGMRSVKIHEGLIIDEPFVLVTYTNGQGNVPKSVSNFLINNKEYLKGVAASGNRNWGNNYGKSADIISHQYRVPIILKFELDGLKGDVINFKQKVEELNE